MVLWNEQVMIYIRLLKIEFTFIDFETRNYDFKQEEKIMKVDSIKEIKIDKCQKLFK